MLVGEHESFLPLTASHRLSPPLTAGVDCTRESFHHRSRPRMDIP
jgi:hypothetical protein